MSQKKRYEVYQTNPLRVIFEGPLVSAVACFNMYKEEYFNKNQTLGIRVLNSYHWEWVDNFCGKYYGFTVVNPENGKETFCIDFDHEYNIG